LLTDFWTEFQRFLKEIKIPDVVFMLRVRDFLTCRIKGVKNVSRPTGPVQHCSPLLLSFQKIDAFRDIVIPNLEDLHQPLYVFPWDDKVEKLFMRATPYCQGGGSHQHFHQCVHYYFSYSHNTRMLLQ
jgi:hypothetical protein